MTEDEAKKKVCHLPQRGMCIASLCMAWRTTQPSGEQYDYKNLYKPKGETNPPFSNCPKGYEVTDHSVHLYSARKLIKENEPGTGFCILLGEPL